MKHTRAYILLIASCLTFIISSCDAGLLITGIEIASYPNKLFYVIGIDNELNLDGGTVYLLTKDKPKPMEENIRKMDDTYACEIICDIDFNVAGVYAVLVERYKYSFTFPIQVVSFEELEDIVNMQGNTYFE